MSTQPFAMPIDPATLPPDAPAPVAASEPAPYTSKYATRELADAGIAEQDRYIEQLKSELTAARTAAPAAPGAPPAPRTRLYNALEKTVTVKADDPFEEAISELVRREAEALFEARFGNVTPLLSHAGLEYAAQLAATNPGGDANIPAFVKSPAFQKALNEFPVLKQGVEAFQTNGAAAREQLPQLLQIAYRLYGQPVSAAPASAPSVRTVPSTTPPAPSVPAATNTGERWADNDPRWNMDLREVLNAARS